MRGLQNQAKNLMTIPVNNQKFVVQTAMFMLICGYGGRGDHIFDPEPEVTWTPPSNPNAFKEYIAGANYSGLLYAGMLEYNWIVDIRRESTNQDDWAVGNLVTYYHVLTTCKGVQMLVNPGGKGVDRWDPVTGWVIEEKSARTDPVRIYFCIVYLWEGGGSQQTSNLATSGSRGVSKIIRHPKCFYQTLSFDAAVIIMTRGIAPIEPMKGYMPTAFDYVKEKTIAAMKLDPNENITYESPVCYVASFGRSYYNHDEFYVQDYKIKIRVYITKWKDCGDVWKYICQEDGRECSSDTDNVKQHGGPYLSCFRARAKVGTVCDRDRGAPVVCNGIVIGLVIRGAAPQYCNNLYKIPFVVEKLDRYPEFFDKVIAYNVQPVPTKRRKSQSYQTSTPSPYGGASTNGINWLLRVASAILYILIN